MERCAFSLHHLHRCSKMFLIVLNRLPRLLDLCQRADPVIIFRNVRIVNGALVRCRWLPGYSKRGSQAPFGRFNEGGSQEGEKTKSSPPACRFLCPFLLDKQKKGGSSRAEKRTSSLVRLRPGAAGQYSSAFLFTRGVKRNRGADQCLHWSAKAPPGLSIHIRICRQRKKAPQALWAGCAQELLGSIRLHFFSLAGDREKKSRYRPVFELGDAGHLCGLRF